MDTQNKEFNAENAKSFYQALVKRGAAKESGMAGVLDKLQDPNNGKLYYNALVKRGVAKQDGLDGFMKALYGSEPKGVPYANAPARSSMTDQFGVLDKAAEADAENQRKAAQHIEELQRAQKEAQKPRIMTPEEVNEMAAQPLLQDKGIDLFGQKEKQAQRTQDMLNAQQAPEKALSSINRNTEALDVLKARLEEVENDLKGENKAGTQYNEEMRSLLTENIKRLTEDTRKQQTDYFDQKLSDLNDLRSAAYLKMGRNILNVTDERKQHLQAIAETLDDDVAKDIVRNDSLVLDALKNLQRAKRKATLDNDASGFSKLLSGMATGFDGGAGLTLGLSDISENFHALSAVNRITEGKGTKADYILADSLLDKMNAEELYNPSIYGKIGEGAYESLKFSLEMLLTGNIGGIINKGIKTGVKAFTKAAKKKTIKEVGEKATKSAGKKFIKKVGNDLAASATGSLFSPLMYNEALRRQNENYLFGRDENGEVTVRETSATESLAESFAQALLSNNISRLVERGFGPVMEKGLQALVKPLAKITPQWLKFGNNFLSNLGRNVKDLMSVQGFLPEYAEEFVEELLTRALVEQTSREKELGVGKWDDLFSPEWCKVTAGSVAVIQAAMGLPGFSASTANAAGNSARMRKHMRNLPDNLREEVGRIARMEDDNQRAQALSEVLKRSTDLQRRDILGYITARAANNLGLSFRRAAAQQQETEAYRQTLMTAATDGENLLVASDRNGNRFAYSPVSENDIWGLAYPIEGNAEDSTLQIGKPQQMDISSLDMGSTQAYTVSELLGSLAQRQEAQDEAQDNAIEQQEQQAARPDADAQKVYVAGHEFNYTDPKGNLKTVARGSRIVPIETVQAGADPNTMVQVAITKPGGSTSMPGVMSLSEFQNMVERGYIAAEEQTEADTATDVQTDEAGNPVAEEETLPQEESAEESAKNDTIYYDEQNNPVDADGKLIVEPIESIDELTDEDFEAPTRNVQLPHLPENVSQAIGSNGKPVVIKKNIFEKNRDFHPEFDAEDGRSILTRALYNPDIVGNNHPKTRPYYRVVIQTGDKNAVVVLDVYENKDNTEIVGWRETNEKGLERLKKQAEREDGQLLILSPEKESGSAAALSALPSDLSSADKGTEVSEEKQVRLPENPVAVMYESLLSENEGNEAEAVDTAQQMVANKTAELEQARKSQAKGKTIDAIQAAKRAKREKVTALETEVKFWKDVAAYPEAKRQAEEAARKLQKRIDAQQRAEQARRNNPQRLRLMDRDKALGEPLSLEEYVLRRIATGATKFLWDGTSQGTGGLREHGGGKQFMLQYVDKNLGKVPEVVADDMEQDIRDNYPEFGNVAASEILDVIEAIGVGEQSFSDLMARAEELHNRNDYDAQAQEEAEEAEREERAREEAAADIAQASVEYMSDEEYKALSRPEFVGEMFNTDGTPKMSTPKKQAQEVEKQPSETERAIASAEAQTDTNPTEKQKEAGNYRKGHVKVNGFDLTIENPKGSERSGVDGTGRAWKQTMHNTYGYIRGTEGVDGDHIDVFLSDTPKTGDVFVIDQVNPKTGAFDEHKVMMGFDSEEAAREAYLSNYNDGWQGLGSITRVSQEEFKKWVDSSHRKTKPFADYKGLNIGDMDAIKVESGVPFPKNVEPIEKKQKGGKKSDAATVKAAFAGNDLFLQTKYVKTKGFAIRNTNRYTASEIVSRIEDGIGISTDEARLLSDAVLELYKKNGLPLYSKPLLRPFSREQRNNDMEGDEEVRMRRGEPMQDNDLSEEERSIVERAKADGTYLKAPNGKPSQLSPKQWAQVRTKAFKDWFGDWELADLKNYLLGNNVEARLDGTEFEKDGMPLTDKVVAYYGKEYNGKIFRENFGEVMLDRRSVKDSLSHGIGRLKGAAFAAVPDIIKSGRIIDAQSEWKGRNQDSFTFAAPVRIGVENYVGIVIVTRGKESKKNRFYIHEVIVQKNLQNESIKTDIKADSHSGDIAKILKSIVNTNNASKVVDENGEPLVVYHGTAAEFNAFQSEKGMYWFAKNADYSESMAEERGGERVVDVYLNMKNPYSAVLEPGKFTDPNFEAPIMKAAWAGGYDGVILRKNTDNELLSDTFYVTFSPTQIKSAKENVGTFDIENPDIRFRSVDTEDNISAFANKYGFDVADVQKYADSMRMENSVGANSAFIDMKRKVRIDNTDKSLGEFVKIFAPIKAELYEKFGDVDALNEKYRQRALDERNVMEAARKRAEEEARAERKRLEEFEVMSDVQLDKAYFKAIEDKDEARMRDLVNEAARRNGYVSLDEFKMAHRAPSYDEEGIDKSMVDVANNRDQIRESLNEQFQMNRDRSRDESVSAIQETLAAIDRGEKPTVTIYRAVPKSLKEGRVRNGDWVTLSENYAKNHGNYVLDGDYRIIKEVVPAENLYWDGNDINEWGYDDRSDYRYRNTKNNRKLNDLITRDDAGNIIPLSQRFNARKNDARFRFIGEKGAVALEEKPVPSTSSTSAKAKREAVEALSRRLGVPVVIEDRSTPKGRSRRFDDAKGWFVLPNAKNPNGVIHVNVDNHADVEDVERSIAHEVVAHMGMRKMLGAERYNALLDKVYDAMNAAARAHFEDYARSEFSRKESMTDEEYRAELQRVAADEYIAALAEVGTDPTTWQKVVALVREALRAIGFNLSLSDADIRALLYESKHNLESAAYAAQRDMFRQRQEEFRAAAELDRRIEEDEREDARMRRNLSGTEYDKRLGIIGLTPEGSTKRQEMHNLATLWGKRLLDSSLPVKNLTNHLKQTNGGRVYSDTDLWSLKTTIPSKVMHGIDRFKKNIGNPLSNTLRDIYRATREQQEELGIPAKKKNGTYYIGMYLMAKHMPERNAWMLADRMLGKTIEDIAQKIFNMTGGRGAMSDKDMNELRRNVLTRFGSNYNEALSESSIQELTRQIHSLIEKRNQERFEKEKARAEKKGIEAPVNSMHPLTDEDMDRVAEKSYAALNERIEKLTDEDKDFAGATAFMERFGMKPEEYVELFEAMMRKNGLENELDKMWDLINQATNETLRERLESGLLSREAYDNIMARGWKNYVPLRSWDERNEESADYFEIEYPERIDNNSTVFTNPTIKAEGRHSLADNPLPYIFRDAETAIRKGEENRFFQAVAKLRDDNANFTYIFGNAAFLEGKETSTEKNSHLVPYYNNGVKTNVVFVNPQLAAAVRGDTESAFGKVWRSAALNWIPPVTRYMSAMLTSMNPAFATLNLMRDLGLATLSRFVEAPDPFRGTWDAALFLYEWFKNMPAAIQASAKPDSIYTNNGRNAQLIRAWKENGGETGWHTLNDLRDTKDKLYKEITKSGVRKSLENVAYAIPTAFRFFTEVSENSVRLAAFADAKRRGLDDQAAAFYSKEITTNFNRHSNLSSAVNPLFMFFNASTQGINRILQLAKENPGNFCVAAVGMMMAGFVGAIANAAGGGDDDDYLHRSFYVRANNLVIGKWTIPLAHGFRMFYGLGAAYADYIMGNASEAEMFYNMFGLVGNELMPGPLNLTDITAYNPTEDRINWISQEGIGGYMRNLVPSSVLPFYDIYRNRDFMGGTISQEPFAGTESKYTPRVARSKKNVNPWLEALNYQWAGLWGFDPELDSEIAWSDKKDRPTRYPAVSASDIEYIIGQYAGGTGEFVNDMVKLGTKIARGEDFTKADVPVLKKLYRPTDPENAILSDYYTIKEYADVLQAKIKESLKQAKTNPDLSAKGRRKAVNRLKHLSIMQAESQLKAFSKYEEKVAELYKLQRKGVSEDILKPKRIWLMKEANNLKEGMLRELEPKQGERYARIMKIKDNDLRGLAAFWDFMEETYGGKAVKE